MIFALFFLLSGLGGAAHADVPVPKIKPPSFPLEPGKKPAEPVKPESWVLAERRPPEASEIFFSRSSRDSQALEHSLRARWTYSNGVTDHVLSGTTPGGSAFRLPVRRESATPVGLELDWTLRPRAWSWAAALSVGGSSGQAMTTTWGASVGGTAVTPLNFDFQDLKAAGGIRYFVFPHDAAHQLRLGADLGLATSTFLGMGASGSELQAESRRLALFLPELAYRYAPASNWEGEAVLGLGLPLSKGSEGEGRFRRFRRISAGLEATRYVSNGLGIGVGAALDLDQAEWVQTAPLAISDPIDSREIRIGLSLKSDL